MEWPSLEVRREQSFLLFFHKLHSDMVECTGDILQSGQGTDVELSYVIIYSTFL